MADRKYTEEQLPIITDLIHEEFGYHIEDFGDHSIVHVGGKSVRVEIRDGRFLASDEIRPFMSLSSGHDDLPREMFP
jgi:hypothetical protein